MHQDTVYDSRRTRDLLIEVDCDWEMIAKERPLQAGIRCVVHPTNSRPTCGFKKLSMYTERTAQFNGAMVVLAKSIIEILMLIRAAWVMHR